MVWEERRLGYGCWTMPATVDYPSVSEVWIRLVRSVSVNQVFTNTNIPVDTGDVLPDKLPSQKYSSLLSPTPHTCHHVRQALIPLTGFRGLCISSGPEPTLQKKACSIFFLTRQTHTCTSTRLHIQVTFRDEHMDMMLLYWSKG